MLCYVGNNLDEDRDDNRRLDHLVDLDDHYNLNDLDDLDNLDDFDNLDDLDDLDYLDHDYCEL